MATNSHAIDFESGSSQYLSVPNTDTAFNLSTGTIELWIKPERHTTQSGIVVNHGALSGTRGFNFILQADGKIRFYLGDATATVTSVSTLSDGVAYHVAVAWDTTDAKIYINTVLDNTSSSWGTLSGACADPIKIGNETLVNNYFDGVMDDIRIWNTKRTQAQILANWKTEQSASASLLFYLKLNNNITDSATGARTVTNNGAATFISPGLFVHTQTVSLSETVTMTDTVTIQRQILKSVSDTVSMSDDVARVGKTFKNTQKPSDSTFNNTDKY